VHRRSTEIRCSIFSKWLSSDLTPARVRSADRTNPNERQRIDLLYHSSSTTINIRKIRIRQLVQAILFMVDQHRHGQRVSNHLKHPFSPFSSTATKKAAMRNRAVSAVAVEDRRPTSVSHLLPPEYGSK
ncbi:hypothetical protein ACLOJK_029454, partial [Asimina triloba]